ncbi:hypothetical protein [Lysinibacillus sp. SGAir0095]|uniref:hypothetical protein n=1 Tax=Lysinibacillus sp. SGAir0095 TaxID=2070463 RepID=UPI0010CD401F|nr:hypothetical protein [Lysinibacillus sp. SGAir0095]QCR32248.1 hypothetical protein C1N55_08710 [Lysinibacillus sp. SGAir0095]
MKLKLLIVLVLMFPFVVHFSTTSSFACSCIQPGTAVEEMDRSDFVYSGKVLEITDTKAGSNVQSSADLLEIHFEVSTSWKGANETEALVYTERDSASCGFNFKVDEEYLVYGNVQDGKKSVNLCSKTTLLANAKEDLVALGEGQKPTELVDLGEKADGVEHEHSAAEEHPMAMTITIFAFVVLVIIIFSYAIVKKNSQR